jgi:Bacterial toxin 8
MLNIIKATANAESGGMMFDNLSLGQKATALNAGMMNSSRASLTGLFQDAREVSQDFGSGSVMPDNQTSGALSQGDIATIRLDTIVVTGSNKNRFISASANVLDNTSSGINSMVNSVGAGPAEAAIFGIQLALGGVPKTLIGMVTENLFGEAKKDITGLVGGLIADKAFDVNGKGKGQAEDINKVSNALSGFGIEAALGTAGGMIGASKSVSNTMDAVRDNVKNTSGRSGRQPRLRELANDDKLGAADRGWLKQEINAIERGQRDTIRVPPGSQLAHERGRESAKGYDYGYSNLQDKDLHRLQHKFDDWGRANRERPPGQ